jgi:hypothetical protein
MTGFSWPGWRITTKSTSAAGLPLLLFEAEVASWPAMVRPQSRNASS